MDPTSADQQAWDLLRLNGIDQHWLTAQLGQGRFDGTVTGIEPTVVGTGQVGENVRCQLTWQDSSDVDSSYLDSLDLDSSDVDSLDDGARPNSVVIKLASSNEKSRAAAEATRTYIREVGFYRDIARSVAIRIPEVYHVSEDRPANRFILVMEDIAPAEAGNQLVGCSIEQATTAVEAAADLHGSTWGRSGELSQLDWIDEFTPEQAEERTALFRMLYPGFVDRYRARLSDDELSFGRWLESNFDRWLMARTEAQCLVHGDFRLDNLLFGAGYPAPPLTTVDWQTVSLGRALSDVAYFLSGSLDRTTLGQNEADLLARYRARLAHHGVDLSAEQVTTEYRLAAPAGYVMAVIASQLVGQTDRGDDMFMVMASGSAGLALERDTPELVM